MCLDFLQIVTVVSVVLRRVTLSQTPILFEFNLHFLCVFSDFDVYALIYFRLSVPVIEKCTEINRFLAVCN